MPDQADGLWRGSIRVKFGPTVAVFRGEATLTYDHAARTCTIEGRGIDQRGASRALASGVVKASGRRRHELDIDGNFTVTGPLETFANAGGVHVARALLAEFSANMAKLVAERQCYRAAPQCAEQQAAVDAPVETSSVQSQQHRHSNLITADLIATPRAAELSAARSCGAHSSLGSARFISKGDQVMSKLQVSDMLAQAFAAEGVDTLFTLMGDANMYWSAAMAELPGVRVVHARHEHCAVSMADGYARATGKVGVASTTCGPGFTQIMTALTMAARGNTPLVVFAGDAPIAAAWYLQQIDMAPLALATGAHFVPIRHVDRLLDNVREAFQVAATERRPVVLSVPMDLQKQACPHYPDYTPSAELVPIAQRPIPDPAIVDRVVDMIAEAEKPIILAGRGATRSGARAELEALAEQSGALLATSLLGKGLFDGNPYALDIAGAFASDFARERFAEADLVIGVGAGLGHYTTEGGYLYPGAQVVQIDTNPRGLWQGLRTADLHVRADARAAAEAIVDRAAGSATSSARASAPPRWPSRSRPTRPTARSSRCRPTRSIRARRCSSSIARSPRTGTSSSAAATTSASP